MSNHVQPLGREASSKNRIDIAARLHQDHRFQLAAHFGNFALLLKHDSTKFVLLLHQRANLNS